MEDERTPQTDTEQGEAFEDLEVEEGADQVTGGRAGQSADPCEGGE